MIDFAKDAREWGDAFNNAAWKFLDNYPEKSALLFNSCKTALRAAILEYAKLVEKELSNQQCPEYFALKKQLADAILEANTYKHDALLWQMVDSPMLRRQAQQELDRLMEENRQVDY